MRNSKTITPDGKKLRPLRASAGKTQKEIIRGTQIQLRTYQRAEQGKPISPQILSEIAKCHALSLSDVLITPMKRNDKLRVQLQACDGKGARRLLSDLGWGSPQLTFSFEVDPYGDVATMIADVVRFCKMRAAIEGQESEEEFIEAVGELNGRIADLYSHGVNIFYANYLYWTIEYHRCEWCGGQISVRAPLIKARFSLKFSDDPANSRNEVVMSERETKESVYEVATRENFQIGIEPDELEKGLMGSESLFMDNGEYVRSYRAAWNERLARSKDGSLALPSPQATLRLVGRE